MPMGIVAYIAPMEDKDVGETQILDPRRDSIITYVAAYPVCLNPTLSQ
jgi:hypothetical protein